MNKSLRNLSIASLIVVSSIGCRNSERESASSKTAAQPTASAAAEPDAADAIATLEAAKAKLGRNSAGNITSVTVPAGAISEQLLDALAKLPKLQSLAIVDNELALPVCQHIAKLKNLRQLDVRDCTLGNDELAAAAAGLGQLQVLRMSGKTGATTVDDGGMAALKNCPHLKVLSADFLWVSETGLAELTGLKELRELYLAGTLVDDAALAKIAEMPAMQKLRIAKTGVTGEGLGKLTALQLEELDISECTSLDDAALEPVGKIVSLKKLNLWRDPIGDAGVAHLASLKNLEWLNVDNTQVTDAALKPISGLTKLKFLHLGSTAVTDAGMPELQPLKELADLKVTRTAVTEEGVEPLRKANPKLDVQLKYGEPE